MTADTPARKRYSPGHPDFAQPGNQLARTHGAWTASTRERAEVLYEAMMADPATPLWIKTDPSLEPLARDLCRWQAVTDAMWDWISERDLESALTDVTTETETRTKGRVKRESRQVRAVLDQFRRYTATLDAKRDALGIPPAARARMRLDMKPEGPNLMQQAARLILDDRRAAPGERDDAR